MIRSGGRCAAAEQRVTVASDVRDGARDLPGLLRAYTHPRVVAIGFLGFSAGLPFLLVFSTLSAWLRDVGLALSTIGFFSWIGVTYSIKVFWAPVVDHTPIRC